MERYIVYKITCLENNKIYIGYTGNSLEERFKQHLRSAKSTHHNGILYRSMRKYGVDKFSIEEIDSSNSFEDVLEKEKYWIEHYKTNHCRYPNNGYNMTDGGEGAKGFRPTEEQKKRVAQVWVGRTHSEETKKKMSEAKKGKPLSDKQKAHLENLHKDRELTEEQKQKLNSPNAMYKKRKHC